MPGGSFHPAPMDTAGVKPGPVEEDVPGMLADEDPDNCMQEYYLVSTLWVGWLLDQSKLLELVVA